MTVKPPCLGPALAAAVVLLVGCLPAVQGELVTIDFEAHPSMTYWSGNPVPEAARLSGEWLGNYGVVFHSESASPYVAVVALGVGHATSGSQGIGGVNDSGVLSYATPFWLEFYLPSDPTSPATTDFVSLRGDLWPTSHRPVSLEAFDVDGNLLAADTAIDDHAVTLSLSVGGIHAIRISEYDSVAWDDLSFDASWPIVEPPRPPPAGVPESGSTLSLVAMVLLGLAARPGVGTRGRRKQCPLERVVPHEI